MVDMETTNIKIHKSTLVIPLVVFLGKRDGIVCEQSSHKYHNVHDFGLNPVLPLEVASMPIYIERARNQVIPDNNFLKTIMHMRLLFGPIDTSTLQNSLLVGYELEAYDGNPSDTNLRSNMVKHHSNCLK